MNKIELYTRRTVYDCTKCDHSSDDPAQAREHYVEHHGLEVEFVECEKCHKAVRKVIAGQKVCPECAIGRRPR